MEYFFRGELYCGVRPSETLGAEFVFTERLQMHTYGLAVCLSALGQKKIIYCRNSFGQTDPIAPKPLKYEK